MSALDELGELLAKASPPPWTKEGPSGEVDVNQALANADYMLSAVNSLPALLGIVRGLAAIDPIVHHEIDHGSIDAWKCGCCGVEINGRSKLALEWSGDPLTFPHVVMCPWLRSHTVMVPNVIGDDDVR